MKTPTTAGTITDEQIRELRRAIVIDKKATSMQVDDMCKLVELALDEGRLPHRIICEARARCAEILNARDTGKVTVETITDAQIRELGERSQSEPVRRLCKVALNDAATYLRASVVKNARARCAEILNRAKEAP